MLKGGDADRLQIKAATGKAPVAAADEGPRVFNLQKYPILYHGD